MEFGVSKCEVLVLKRRRVVNLNSLVLPNGQMMRDIDERGYKYLGIVEIDKIKETDRKEKFARKCKRRLKLVFKSKLNCRKRY